MEVVYVAGGAGFLGSNLCEKLLQNGYEVICIDNLLTSSKKNIEPFLSHTHFHFKNVDVIDISEKDIENLPKPDYIFHLASPASPNHHSKISYHALPAETMKVNTQGTWKLLEISERSHAKFLFASTSETYGDPLEHPQKESYRGNVSTTGPRSVYDEAKRFGETITAYFARSRNVDARIARIFNTYGPNMQKNDRRMIIDFIDQALHNNPITIFGDGTQTRSLCYVSDMIEGLSRLMFYPNTKDEIVNLGSQFEHTVKEYAEIVKKLTHSTSEIVFSEDLPKDDPLKRRADITKAKALLKWEPTVTLDEGLNKLIEYFKKV